jgi:hypothetical protein
VAAGVAGCAVPGSEETERSTRVIPADPDAPMVVSNVNGRVDVTGTDTDTIEVDIEKRTRYGRDLLDRVTVQTRVSGGRTQVTVRTDSLPPGTSVAVDLDIRIPESVALDSVETRNGAVTATGVAGDASLQTTNGRVTAEDVDGFLILRSTNGDVEARDVTGLDDVRTTNGSVDVELSSLRRDLVVRTSNGDIDLAVPPELGAVVNLRTSNGTVGVRDLEPQITDRSRTALRAILGDGSGRIVAETSNGSVRLRAQ